MKNYEVIIDYSCPKVVFHDKSIILIDIDSIFKNTNIHFCELLDNYGLPETFDFTKPINKKLYIHTFLLDICETIKSSPYKLYFYSNILTKDKFRNTLLKKLKTIFGFNVMEDILEFDTVINLLIDNNCEIVPKLEVFFEKDHKPKTFKHIKRYMGKNGLLAMDDYFKEISNKMKMM